MRRIWASALLVGLLSVSCAEREARYLLYTIESKDADGAWISGGFGCTLIDTNGGSGTSEGSAGEGFSVTLQTVRAAAEFTVEVDGKIIEHRVFDDAFLRSTRHETVTFTLPIGEQRYNFRAGDSCDEVFPDAG